MNLVEQIEFYYKERGLVFPDFNNAMKWVQTELGEVYEQDLARSGNWVRNNPQDHDSFSKRKLAEELGDVVFMLIVAGMAEGVDVIDVMLEKMARKLEERKLKVATGISKLELVDVNPSGWVENIDLETTNRELLDKYFGDDKE